MRIPDRARTILPPRGLAPLVALALLLSSGCPDDDDDDSSAGDDDTTAGDDDSAGDDDTTAGDDDDLPPEGRLAARGARLVDHHGRTITLRGVNAGGRSRLSPYAPFEFDPGQYEASLDGYLDRIDGWGMNTLRVPFSWQGAEPERGQYDEDYLARIDALLDGAWERGLWTILVFQQDRYAEPVCGTGFPFWTFQEDDLIDPWTECPGWFDGYTFDDDVRGAFTAFWDDWNGNRTAFEAMWTMMAERHGDRPGVVGFELMNTPEAGFTSDREAWAGETLTGFYGELIAGLRPLAPDTLLLVDVPALDMLDGDTSLQPPPGEDLVLVVHHYDPTILFADVAPGDGPEQALQGWADLAEGWGWPLLLGGAGVDPSAGDATAAARAYLEVVDARGMHATWWDYSQAAELWNFEDLSLVDAAGEPREALLDGVVRPYVRALAGAVVEAPAYDPAARRFTLEYTPDPALGATEIAVPGYLYADGASSTCEGAVCSLSGGVLTAEAEEGASSARVTVEPG